MIIENIPTELSLLIINYLNYSDIIRLVTVSNHFNHLIKNNIQAIYQLKSKELIKHNIFNENLESNINYNTFIKLFIEHLKEKKRALVIIKYIYNWLKSELADSVMERSFLPINMINAIHYAIPIFLNDNQYYKYSQNLLKL